MVRVVRNDGEMIKILENALQRYNINCPSHAGDKNYRTYLERVRKHCQSLGHNEQDLDTFFAEVESYQSFSFPTEVDLGWFKSDARASLWLACELYSETQGMTLGTGVLDILSPDSLPPDHLVRIQNIRKVIYSWPLSITPKEFMKSKAIEWAKLIEHEDLFSDFSSQENDVSGWLKGYLDKHIPSLGVRVCGNSRDETLAWCYALYFEWRKKNSGSPDTVSLFKIKFKSAWATQKNRLKNKVYKKLKPLNIYISEDAHRMLRTLALDECISNDKVVEHAIMAAYKNKRSKQ
ncbi:hypothetical protein ACSBQN_12390 [Morganella sp. B601]|nr:hypothetical protein [Serratia fonticola]EKW3935673.1 hypothetical protein [Morganella morganii]HDS3824845.1 hypothetical protein [Morganella morganii subsp. morganii]EKW3938390.1 hypothetical protein [Morganella morganii]MBP1016863.1 hypothetical protein [Serratia fonticola]HBN5913038.1 hypothetical protein [Morganella morganii]